MNEHYCVVTFEITSHAFIFEKEMKKRDINIKLISTPRQLSSSCGLSAEIPCEIKKEVQDICSESKIDISKVHELQRDRKSFLKFK